MLPSSVEVKRRAHRNVHNPVYRRSWPMAPPHGHRNPKVCMHLILQVQELQMMRVFKVSDGTNDQFEKTSFSFLFLLLLVIEVLFTEILSNVLSDLTCME